MEKLSIPGARKVKEVQESIKEIRVTTKEKERNVRIKIPKNKQLLKSITRRVGNNGII